MWVHTYVRARLWVYTCEGVCERESLCVAKMKVPRTEPWWSPNIKHRKSLLEIQWLLFQSELGTIPTRNIFQSGENYIKVNFGKWSNQSKSSSSCSNSGLPWLFETSIQTKEVSVFSPLSYPNISDLFRLLFNKLVFLETAALSIIWLKINSY